MLRIIFMGPPELARASLEALAGSPDFQLAAVVTQPDRPKGRDLKLTPSPVKELALHLALPVLQPKRARDEPFFEQLRAHKPDLIAVAAYGQILPVSRDCDQVGLVRAQLLKEWFVAGAFGLQDRQSEMQGQLF